MLYGSQLPQSSPTNRHRCERLFSDDRLVFVDIETAGLQSWRPIIQIAAIAVTASLHVVEEFEAKIQFDEHRAVRRALCKRHYSRARWRAEGRRERDVAVDFAAFLTRHATVHRFNASGRPFVVAQLVAHNAGFDGPFLRAWFERLGLFFPGSYRLFCTMQRAMWMFHEDRTLTPPSDFKLGTLCEYFGALLPADQAHDALADVRATVELYRLMCAGRLSNRKQLLC
jgi:DNA polymerase III epsilon subunit-like protein